MTVTTTTTTNTYTGDGTTTAFSFTFEILETTDIKVIVVTTATGVESVRSIGTGSTNYAVTGTGNVNGGTVTFVTAPTASETVFLMRNMSFTQPTDYRTNDPFPAETHENALDRMALQIQQISRRLDRALLRPESDTTSGALPHNIDLKGGVLKFNSSSGVPEADSSLTDVATSSANGLMSSSDKAKLDGIETSATTDQTASEILSSIKTVDGASSGLDADLLDGQQGSYYLDASNFSGLGTVATLNVGIGNNNIPKFTSGVVDNDFLKVDGSVIEGRSASEVVSDLGVITADSTTTLTNKTIDASQLSGTVANARLDAQLQDVAGLAVTDGGFIVGDGSNFVLETGSTVRTSLGLGTAATLDTGISNTNVPKFTSGVVDDDFLRVDGTAIEGRSASQVLSDIGGQASLTFGISNTNAVKIDSTSVADDEYARFTASGLESRSNAEVLSDIGAQASLTFGISNTNAVKIDSSSVADDEYARFTANGLESRSTSEVLSDIGGITASSTDTLTNKTLTNPTINAFSGTGDASITGDLTLISTGGGSASDPQITFFRNSASPADNDALGKFVFKGNNSAAEETQYASIVSRLTDATNGTEDGTFELQTITGGSVATNVRIDASSTVGVRLLNGGERNIRFDTGTAFNGSHINLAPASATGARTVTLPDATGTVSLLTNTETLTNKTLTTPVINGFSGTGDGSITGNLTLTSTDAGAGNDPQLILHRNSASPAVNDEIGEIIFKGRNDASQDVNYAIIESNIVDETDGTEDGGLKFRLINNGSDALYLNMTSFFNVFYQHLLLKNRNIIFEGANEDDHETTLTVTEPTADRTITLPDSTGTVQVTSSSDRRLKKNIEPAQSASQKIDDINVYQFDWIEDGKHEDFGVVAQEMQEVFPDCVAVQDPETGYLGIDYSKLVPVLLKELKDLRARVSDLENKDG